MLRCVAVVPSVVKVDEGGFGRHVLLFTALRVLETCGAGIRAQSGLVRNYYAAFSNDDGKPTPVKSMCTCFKVVET